MGQCVGKQGRKRRADQDAPGMAHSPDSSKQRKSHHKTVDDEDLPTPTSQKKSPRKKSSPKQSTSSASPYPAPVSFSNNDNSNGPSAGDDKSKTRKKKKETVYAKKNVEKLFDRFKDAPETTEVGSEMDPAIGPEGIERLCREVEIDPDDVVLLVLAFHLNASEMGYFYRDEWINGLEKLKLDTVDKIRDHFEVMRKELDEPERLKTIYRRLFGFAKSSPEQKCVDIDTAIGILNLFLAPRVSHVKSFVEFLQSHPGSVKALNLDQWTSLYEFAVTVKEDFSNYDENGAWPCVMDDYVQWRKGEKSNAGEGATDSF